MHELIRHISSIEALLGDLPNQTEADLRGRIIDPLLSLMGWAALDIYREPYNHWVPNPGFLDYLITIAERPHLVIEAKKSSRPFGIPAKLSKAGMATLADLVKTGSADLREALDQCSRYAQHCGAPFAIATNGREFLAFKALQPGRGLNDAKVVIFASPADILKRLDQFNELLGFEQCRTGAAEFHLVGHTLDAPTFAQTLSEKFPYRSSQTTESITYGKLIDLVVKRFILDLADDESFARCYVSVDWTKTTDDALEALITNQVTAFEGMRQERGGPSQVLSVDAISSALDGHPVGRTVILHGPVGIGKSSYVRHMRQSVLSGKAKGLDGRFIWAHLDLLSFRDTEFDKGRDRIVAYIAEKLRGLIAESAQSLGGNFDPEQWKHLRDIYNKEARRFQKERFPDSDDSDSIYLNELRAYIFRIKESSARDHLVRTLTWLTKTIGCPTVVVLDNSDQLGLEFQEYLYDIAATIERETTVVTILCLRTEALMSHRVRAHAIARIEERFEVQRPALSRLVRARFEEIERQIIGQFRSKADPSLIVALDRFSVLLSCVSEDLKSGGEIARIIETIGNGGIRRTLRTLSFVFKQEQKVMDQLVTQDAKRPGTARLQADFVLRAILRAGRGRYTSADTSNVVPNVLTVSRTVKEPHSLSLYMLRYVSVMAASGDGKGVAVHSVISGFSYAGVDPGLVKHRAEFLWRSGLLEIPTMSESIRDDDYVQVTVLGRGMLEWLVARNSYLDAVLWDTTIYDNAVFSKLSKAFDDFRSSGSFMFEQMRNIFWEYMSADEALFRRQYSLDTLPKAAWAEPFFRARGTLVLEKNKQ